MNAPLLVPVERRKHVRYSVAMPATVALRDGAELQSCTVLDVSPGGGRIKLHAPVGLPDAFTLLLTPSGSVRRSCRVIWRRGDQVGLEFYGLFDHFDEAAAV